MTIVFLTSTIFICQTRSSIVFNLVVAAPIFASFRGRCRCGDYCVSVSVCALPSLHFVNFCLCRCGAVAHFLLLATHISSIFCVSSVRSSRKCICCHFCRFHCRLCSIQFRFLYSTFENVYIVVVGGRYWSLHASHSCSLQPELGSTVPIYKIYAGIKFMVTILLSLDVQQ